MRIKPLYIAAVISGVAAALWHSIMTPPASQESKEVEQGLGFDSHKDYVQLEKWLAGPTVGNLSESDKATMHKWFLEPRKTLVMTAAVAHLDDTATMQSFVPDLEKLAATPGWEHATETVLSIWAHGKGRPVVQTVAHTGSSNIRPFAEQALNEKD